jgi:phosphatidylinositol alpha-1,6-mannosyltransferase
MMTRLATVNLADPDPKPGRAGAHGVASVGGPAHRDGAGLDPGPTRRTMPRTLLVTNDFPPRRAASAVRAQARVRQRADSLVVYASTWRGAAEFDAEQPFEVVREHRRAAADAPGSPPRAEWRAHDCDTSGSGRPRRSAARRRAAPPRRRPARDRPDARHEVGWAALPGARAMLKRIGTGVDVATYLSEYQRVRPGARAAEPGTAHARGRHRDVPPVRRRGRGAQALRPVRPSGGVCVSRLVPRKGQDALIRACRPIRRKVPGAALLIVSGGPDRKRLDRLAAAAGVAEHVVFTGSVPWAICPPTTPPATSTRCRAAPAAAAGRRGLGIVYLEASATGLPVLAGDSGGAPDAVKEARPAMCRRRATSPRSRPADHAAPRPRPRGPDGRGRPCWVEEELALETQAERWLACWRP